MRIAIRVLCGLFGLLFCCCLLLIIGMVLTPQKVLCVAEKELIRFSGSSVRASFTCPADLYFEFLIAFSDGHVATNFDGKVRIIDSGSLLVERKIQYLAGGNLLENKNMQNVYAIRFDPNDGYGQNWGSNLVTNQSYVVELVSNVHLVDAILYYTYTYHDYVENWGGQGTYRDKRTNRFASEWLNR